MLNLTYIYEDAINAVENYSEHLRVPSVAATVYMLQQDVINSYRHALEHYFTISLNEHYLKNSSLGTPYQKWQHITNEDYQNLSFSINNLLSYTSRLCYESRDTNKDAIASISNDYISPIVEISHRNRFIGIRILDDKQLELSKLIYDRTPKWAVWSV